MTTKGTGRTRSWVVLGSIVTGMLVAPALGCIRHSPLAAQVAAGAATAPESQTGASHETAGECGDARILVDGHDYETPADVEVKVLYPRGSNVCVLDAQSPLVLVPAGSTDESVCGASSGVGKFVPIDRFRDRDGSLPFNPDTSAWQVRAGETRVPPGEYRIALRYSVGRCRTLNGVAACVAMSPPFELRNTTNLLWEDN